MNFFKFFQVMLYSLCTCMVLQASESDSKRAIVPYTSSYEKEIKKIAVAHMHQLYSGAFFDKRPHEQVQEHFLQTQIEPALTSSDIVTKVCLAQEQPVGFITYSLSNPWHRIVTPCDIGPNATIHHLAVASAHKKEGYGTLLMQHALNDCKQQSVNRISLWTVGGSAELDMYYKRFGFYAGQRTRLNDQQYILRLKPYPALVMLNQLLKVVKK